MKQEWICAELKSVAESMLALAAQADVIQAIADACTKALKAGKKVMFCGNGGSAADSQHLAAEFVGRYKMERKALNSIALTVDTSILTAIGNDYGYDDVVGGGAKNEFLNRLTEEATGMCVAALPIEATALGNLKNQMEAE